MAAELIRNYDSKTFLLVRNKHEHLMDYYLIYRADLVQLKKTVKQNIEDLFIDVFATEFDAEHNKISLLNKKVTPLGKRKLNTLEIFD